MNERRKNVNHSKEANEDIILGGTGKRIINRKEKLSEFPDIRMPRSRVFRKTSPVLATTIKGSISRVPRARV